MSHPGTEETRFDERELWLLVSVSCLGLGGFLLVFVLLVFFSPFPSLSMITWALRPHGVRTRGKKRPCSYLPPPIFAATKHRILDAYERFVHLPRNPCAGRKHCSPLMGGRWLSRRALCSLRSSATPPGLCFGSPKSNRRSGSPWATGVTCTVALGDGRRDWSKGAWPVGLLRCAETEQGYEDFNQAQDLQRLSLSELVHGVQLELAP